MKYEARVKTIIVVPSGKPLFDESATEISIEDEAGGEFIELRSSSDDGKVRFDPDEWPTIRGAIDQLVKDCREYA